MCLGHAGRGDSGFVAINLFARLLLVLLSCWLVTLLASTHVRVLDPGLRSPWSPGERRVGPQLSVWRTTLPALVWKDSTAVREISTGEDSRRLPPGRESRSLPPGRESRSLPPGRTVRVCRWGGQSEPVEKLAIASYS